MLVTVVDINVDSATIKKKNVYSSTVLRFFFTIIHVSMHDDFKVVGP